LGDAVRADWGRAARAQSQPSRGGNVIQDIERAIPTAEVDRSAEFDRSAEVDRSDLPV
jgi:hypothetical protein